MNYELFRRAIERAEGNEIGSFESYIEDLHALGNQISEQMASQALSRWVFENPASIHACRGMEHAGRSVGLIESTRTIAQNPPTRGSSVSFKGQIHRFEACKPAIAAIEPLGTGSF